MKCHGPRSLPTAKKSPRWMIAFRLTTDDHGLAGDCRYHRRLVRTQSEIPPVDLSRQYRLDGPLFHSTARTPLDPAGVPVQFLKRSESSHSASWSASWNGRPCLSRARACKHTPARRCSSSGATSQCVKSLVPFPWISVVYPTPSPTGMGCKRSRNPMRSHSLAPQSVKGFPIFRLSGTEHARTDVFTG